MEPCCAVCFLGRTPKCKTPSVDVQSVPRFTHRDHTAVRSIKKENHQRLLLWEVSVMQQRRSGGNIAIPESAVIQLATDV